MLSLQAALEHIRHTLGGPLSGTIDGKLIVNQAQHFLTTVHAWKWLDRSAALDLTTGENWIDLPTDFVQLLPGYAPAAGAGGTLRLTTLQEILDARSGQVGGTGFGYAAVLAYSSAAAPGGPPVARLELDQTPSVTVTGAFSIFYKADLPDVTDDQEFISIPTWLEAPFIQLVRAFARGYEEEDQLILQQRLAACVAGVDFQAAIVRDGMVQPDYGIQRGGLVEESQTDYWYGPPHVTPLAVP